MSTFSFISKIFGSDDSLSEQDQQKLFEELLFLTLSRASRSDLDISDVEVSKIQEIIKRDGGIEASEQEIRTAGMSELYEIAPLEKYVAKASKGLKPEQCATIFAALYELINVDNRISVTEAEFVNGIANAMNLQPVELLGAKIDRGD